MRDLGIAPSVETFNCLLMAARNSSINHVSFVVDLMRQAQIPPDSTTYHSLIMRYVLDRNLEYSVQLLDDMSSHGIAPRFMTVQEIVMLAAKMRNPRLGLDILSAYEAASARTLSEHAWMQILIASAEAYFEEGTRRAWDKIVNKWNIIPDEGLCIRVLHTAARYGLPDLAGEALATLNLMGVPKQEHFFAALVEAFVHAGSIKEAFATLSFMRAHDVPPVPETGMSIYEAVSRDLQSADDAFNALDELHKEGRGVDIAALNVLVHAAVGLHDLARAVGIHKAAADFDLTPDIHTYNFLLEGCITKSHVELAEKILVEMKENDLAPDSTSFDHMIRLSLGQDNYEHAFYYLERSKEAGCAPSADIYDAIVRKCVAARDERYKLALEEMELRGFEPLPSLLKFVETGGLHSTIGEPYGIRQSRRQEVETESHRTRQELWFGNKSHS